ncbi:MAG: hypothetical protein DRP65_04090, partial [Planctomycetota bacterium]
MCASNLMYGVSFGDIGPDAVPPPIVGGQAQQKRICDKVAQKGIYPLGGAVMKEVQIIIEDKSYVLGFESLSM